MVIETMGRAMEEYREILENLAEATVKTVKSMVEQMKEMMRRIKEGQILEQGVRQGNREGGGAEEGGEGGVGGGDMEARRQAMGTMSFAQVARRAEHKDMMQRRNNKTRQMLVDNIEGNESWKGLTERELVEKARIARDLMSIQGLDSPKIEFLSARALKNGGILYELNSTDAASWLAKLDVWKAFIDRFGTGAKVKDRAYNIFLEFVLVTLGNVPAENLELVESVNGLQPGKLVTA